MGLPAPLHPPHSGPALAAAPSKLVLQLAVPEQEVLLEAVAPAAACSARSGEVEHAMSSWAWPGGKVVAAGWTSRAPGNHAGTTRCGGGHRECLLANSWRGACQQKHAALAPEPVLGSSWSRLSKYTKVPCSQSSPGWPPALGSSCRCATGQAAGAMEGWATIWWGVAAGLGRKNTDSCQAKRAPAQVPTKQPPPTCTAA